MSLGGEVASFTLKKDAEKILAGQLQDDLRQIAAQ
jgi:hypothetical protein